MGFISDSHKKTLEHKIIYYFWRKHNCKCALFATIFQLAETAFSNPRYFCSACEYCNNNDTDEVTCKMGDGCSGSIFIMGWLCDNITGINSYKKLELIKLLYLEKLGAISEQ